MSIQVTVSAGLLACALATAAPALAGNAGTASPHDDHVPHLVAGRTPNLPRALHPTTGSGGEPGTPVRALPSYRPGGGSLDRLSLTGEPVRWQVVPGVTYTRWSQVDRRGPVVAHLLTVDPSTPGLLIDYASPGPVRRVARVRDILRADGAVAGVNGDFFDIGHTGAPLGLGKDRQRGLLHGRARGWNNAFFVDRHGEARVGTLPVSAWVLGHPGLHVTNLNSAFVMRGGIGVYTPRFGRTAGYLATPGQHHHVREVRVRAGRVVSNRPRLGRGKVVPGLVLVGRGDGATRLRRTLPVGTRVRVGWSLAMDPQMAISGHQLLVRDGVSRPVDGRVVAPRTAVGVDRDTGNVLLLVVDGGNRSRGYTLAELANLMLKLGADEAVNLDGGGSSTMVARNRAGETALLNTPSDGYQRRVSNALEVTYTPAPVAGAPATR